MMTSLYVSAVILLVGVACERSRQPRNVAEDDVLPSGVKEQLERSEVLMTTSDYTTKYGYPVETHTVRTEDGYLLTVHRIPGSPKAASSGVKTPVLLQHGMGQSSDCWLLTGPEKGLGFILADEGYDVWMGNARGNRYSRKHETLSPRNSSFYNFTWHEMGVYDLPAVIDHVLETTNHTRLFYIGHSMGATMFFVLASVRPEYNHKIRLMVAMAPGVFFGKVQSLITTLGLPIARPLYVQFKNAKVIGQTLGMAMKLPMARLIYALCGDGKPFQNVCMFTYFSMVGFNEKELNKTLLPSIISHALTGNSIHLHNHYAQVITTGRFQMYDRSGRQYSPQLEYDLSKVTAPVSVHYGLNDILIGSEGVIRLSKSLPNLVKLVQLSDEKANHNDFLYAIHVREMVYNEVLDLLKK